MKHVIVIRNGAHIVGVASNLKKALSLIKSRWLQSYSTIALTVSCFKPYHIGSGRVNGVPYENLRLEKFEVNRFPG